MAEVLRHHQQRRRMAAVAVVGRRMAGLGGLSRVPLLWIASVLILLFNTGDTVVVGVDMAVAADTEVEVDPWAAVDAAAQWGLCARKARYLLGIPTT